jgi:ABC-type glycerol-3-phosphate transport system substrate-binding protein
MLGIPTDNSGMWLAVNQDLLKQAGVKPPPTMKRESLQATTSGVWTWEQVLAAAKQVSRRPERQV